MPHHLRVIPDLLARIGTQLADHGEALLASQQSCHSTAQDAQAGWVGASAHALSGLLERWATASTAHLAYFGEHSCGMHFAAAGFSRMEQRNAAALAETRNDVDVG